MSRATSMHRVRSMGLPIALAIFGGSPAAASAAVPLHLPKIKPRVTIPEIPRPAIAVPEDFTAVARYGTTDADIVASLERAENGVADDVDATATRVGSTPLARSFIKLCAAEGLKAAGESYGDSVLETFVAGEPTIPPPDFRARPDTVDPEPVGVVRSYETSQDSGDSFPWGGSSASAPSPRSLRPSTRAAGGAVRDMRSG